MNKPTPEQIDDILNKCSESEDNGESAYPGMTYEQGLKAGIEWVQYGGENPLD